MRFLIVFLFFFNFIFANNGVLSLNEAFKLNSYSNNQGIFLKINLADRIYLYKDQIKVELDSNDITSLLNFPPTQTREDKEVIFSQLELFIPQLLLNDFVKNNKAKLSLTYQGCSEEGLCYRPVYVNYKLNKQNGIYTINSTKDQFKNQNEDEQIANDLSTQNIFITLLTFFGYGLLLALTPCILPMIPILSSLIAMKLKDKPSKKHSFYLSFIYVFFMSLAYAIAGALVGLAGANVQGLLQQPWIIITFASIFILLSLSMFGLYELQLPLKFQNFINKKIEGKNGVFGVAIMGFLSALIVGPCVAAPLAGALLYITNSGDVFLGGLSLFAMSFGMGVPLLLIGLGGSFLKSGAWMLKVKIFFGFIMLIMAVWMLERILSANIVLILYGVIGVFFASFMGLFDEAKTNFDKFKKASMILVLAYSLSLILGGSMGSKSLLKPLEFNLAIKENGPSLNFKTIKNLKELEQELQNSTKPIMLEFTATWCENCKLLEEYTFKDIKVKNLLANYTLLKADITHNTQEDLALMKEFGVFGPPVIIFFDKSEEKGRIIGYVDANDFLNKVPR
ncbi:thiol:disulfide interchange protein [Campylobacter ornithocola]|uniref:Thiol:disulfide interchange protein n=1 Tax=Campylobacter ornithocola TaxID=1848766 RepID=A0A6M8N674_9BACT|nr:protein-disulfide reductase DsbD [Campylobacter ornithocola]OCX43630.1 thiol:disulfide interchange protein [Campylobacter ornithocola]QKF57483.1 thiol:disulfide interchange protein DsbD [Campylobacter ornithocola]